MTCTYELKKILVVGGNGQVGRKVSRLLGNQYHVYQPHRSELDFCYPDKMKHYLDCIKPDVIINCAAYTDVEKAEVDREAALVANSLGPELLSKYANLADAVLLHFSTDYVFEGSKLGAHDEDDELNPLNTYGRTKMEGENNVRRYCRRHIIIRTSWVYDRDYGSNFYRTMVNLFKQNEIVKVVNDQWGAPTETILIAKAVQKILKDVFSDKQLNWGTYHFSGEEKLTWYQFAQWIFSQEKNNHDFKVKQIIPILSAELNYKALRPTNSYLSNAKFNSEFGKVS